MPLWFCEPGGRKRQGLTRVHMYTLYTPHTAPASAVHTGDVRAGQSPGLDTGHWSPHALSLSGLWLASCRHPGPVWCEQLRERRRLGSEAWPVVAHTRPELHEEWCQWCWEPDTASGLRVSQKISCQETQATRQLGRSQVKPSLEGQTLETFVKIHFRHSSVRPPAMAGIKYPTMCSFKFENFWNVNFTILFSHRHHAMVSLIGRVQCVIR